MSIINQAIIYPRSIVTEERQVSLGEIPLRRDISYVTLPADPVASPRIGWVMYEEIGIGIMNARAINFLEVSGTFSSLVNPIWYLFDCNDKETVRKLVLEEEPDSMPILGFAI